MKNIRLSYEGKLFWGMMAGLGTTTAGLLTLGFMYDPALSIPRICEESFWGDWRLMLFFLTAGYIISACNSLRMMKSYLTNKYGLVYLRCIWVGVKNVFMGTLLIAFLATLANGLDTTAHFGEAFSDTIKFAVAMVVYSIPFNFAFSIPYAIAVYLISKRAEPLVESHNSPIYTIWSDIADAA